MACPLAVDSSGNAYLTGRTHSTDFPTTLGAFQPAFAGGSEDGFVTKLNAAGSALVYSTYLGGSTPFLELGSGIAVDSSGDAYVTGETSSTDFPTTWPRSRKGIAEFCPVAHVQEPAAGGAMESLARLRESA